MLRMRMRQLGDTEFPRPKFASQHGRRLREGKGGICTFPETHNRECMSRKRLQAQKAVRKVIFEYYCYIAMPQLILYLLSTGETVL